MPDETKTQGNHIIIQNITDSTITLTVDGELREIQNQLAELKSLVESLKAQKVQYAEKIYNIGHINEANFGFFTGKKTFNEQLTKRLITAIAGYCPPARTFLENAEKIQEWESQARISDKAKEIIAYSFVGVIGIQLSKLMAIGKEDFSDAKQRKYIQKCIQIAKWSLNLVNFALLSRLWDAQKQNPHALPSHLQTILASYFNTPFEWTIEEQFLLLKTFAEIFNTQGVGLAYPIKELDELKEQFQNGSDLHQHCRNLQLLNEKLDKSQYDLLDCYEAENQLATFLAFFSFLVNYRMASIRYIGYRQIRRDPPGYLHRYNALGIDSKANVDAEKVNYTDRAGHTDAVLLYQGNNYSQSTNLSPFVIDYNALTFEHGAKICFFRTMDSSDSSLEYLFLEDNSVTYLESTGTLTPNANYDELMMDDQKRKKLNIDNVVQDFLEARDILIGDTTNPEDQ